MPKLLYAWRLLAAGKPTAITVLLDDCRDAHLLAAAKAQLEERGFQFVPVELAPEELPDELLPAA